jgi:hypothetical protein
MPTITALNIEYVYREYNSSADGLANQAIDEHDPRRHVSGIVVDNNWSRFDNALNLRFVDDEGDFIME